MSNLITNYLRIRIQKITSLILIISVIMAICSCSKNSGNFDGKRFDQTKTISVMSDSTNSLIESYIHDKVLQDCNINVVFVSSVHYMQDYGIVPDISFTSNTNRITTYYRMRSVMNIAPYINSYSDSLSDLKAVLGDENMYSSSDDHSEVWYMTAQSNEPYSKVTFIRADWLDKLGLKLLQPVKNCMIALLHSVTTLRCFWAMTLIR